MSNITTIPLSRVAPIATPILLGYALNWGLYGALSIQTYLYHVSFPRDGWPSKALVYIVYLVETAQTIIITHDAFNTFVRSFGDLPALALTQNEWLAIPVLSAIVCGVVQMYYAYRLKLLSGSNVLSAVITILALIQGVAGIICGVQAFRVGSFQGLLSQTVVVSSIWLTANTVCDLVIAVSMGYYMARKAARFGRPRYIWITFVRVVIETGSITAIISTIDLALFISAPDTTYFICTSLVLSKLTANSLLVILNAQTRILGARNFCPAGSSSHGCGNRSGNGGHVTGRDVSANGSEEADHMKARGPMRLTLNSRTAAVALGLEQGEERDGEVIHLDDKSRSISIEQS